MSSEHVYIEVVTTDSPTIHISFLGKMTIEQAGQPVIKLSGQKVTALLAYLVCNPGPHTRIQLADLLWDDIPYDRFLPNLRSTLNRLPKVIKPYIKTTRQTVAFEPTPAVWVDAVALQSLVTSLPNPENLPKGPYFIQLATVKDSLITTVDCYNEPFLDEMDLVDAPRFSDWQFAQQETLEQHYLHGLRVLMALADHEGDNESCIGYAKHIIELDPVDEQVRRQLIMLYARMGEYQAAINEYEGLVQDLRDMLGVSPSPETVAAYQRIESGHHPDTLVVSTFPTFAQPLVGRKHELDTLCHQLQEPQHRLVTVTGMGGVGKTHLAVEAAKMIAQNNDFLQGVTYLSLNGIPSAERLPEALVQALDLILPDQGDLLDQLCHYLAAKEMLIVLDNFEHLLEPHEHRNPTNQHNYIPNRARSQINVGCQILSQILQAAPHVKFLITSRQPLRLQQEYRYPLIGMTPPAVQTNSAISELRTFDAVCLFEQVALQHNRTFEITNDNADAICQFCTMVEGIPLAIMLGAIHMGFLTPQELVAECQESLDVLETEWADLPDRQRSVRAIFEYTWGLLDDASQQIFQKLTVFRGGFNRRAAREVAGASIPQLRRLHAQSLVKLVGKDRYELHELLRQFGAEKLAALNATTDVQSKHMAYYLQWVCTQTDVLDGDKPHIATAMIVPDLENIRQAWTHGLSPLLASPSLGEGQIHHGITALGLGEGLFEHKALPLLSQSLTAIARFYEIKGFHQAGLDILTQAVEMCQAPLADTMPTVVPDAASGTTFSMVETVSPLVEFYSDLLVTQGFFYNQLGQFTEAIQTAETAIGYVYSNQDRLYSAIYTVWGTGLLNQGAFQQAQTKAEQALDHAQQLNSTLLMADSLYLRGYIQFMVNDYDAAITDLRAAHTHYLRIQNRRKEIECVKVLGKVHAWMGQLAVAKRHFEQAIQFSQTIQNELQQQSLTFDLCRTAINMGAYEEAAQQGQSALDFFQHIGNRSMMAILHYHLGVIYMRVGLYDDAYAQLEQALALCRVMSARDKQVNCLVNLAVIASNLDDHEKALLLLQEAEQRSEALEMAYLQGYVHRFMAQAMSQLGEFQQSITLYQSALALYPAELDYQRIEIKAGLVHALHQVGEHDTIDAHLEDVLFYLEQNRDKLYLMINPIAVYLICYQVLNAWQDTRASAIFDAGYTLLQSYADRIQHADWRHSFLENVATNQQLLSINQLKKGNQS